MFATTNWNLVLAAGQSSSSIALNALETLCRTYWLPVYAYIRRHGRSQHEAQDLTQAFFADFLSRRAFDAADPARGQFRTFLLASLRHFLANEWDRARAQKRGGGIPLLSLDVLPAWENRLPEAFRALPPEHVYDQAWAQTVLGRVVRRLREEYSQDGRETRLPWLERTLPGNGCDLTYEDMARQHGLSASAVKSEVHRFRVRFRAILRREVAHTVSRPEDIDEELHALFAAVSQLPV